MIKAKENIIFVLVMKIYVFRISLEIIGFLLKVALITVILIIV
jgi:hypothetical protein